MPTILSTTRALSGVSLLVLCVFLQPAWADPVVLLDGQNITTDLPFDPFQEFVVGAGATGTYSGKIYESGETGYIRKTGAGTLVVTENSNSFSSGATISAGTIRVTGNSVLGMGTITLDGGTLQAGAAGLSLVNHTIQFTSAGGAIDTGAFDLTTHAQMIDGDVPMGTFTKLGSGALILTNEYGFSNYATATNIAQGKIVAGKTNVFSANSGYTVANGASLVLSNYNQAIGSLAGAGTVELGSATLTTGADNKTTAFSGEISGTGKLVKTGSGTQTLTGTNTYSGGTTINGGTIAIGNGSALGAGLVRLSGGALLSTADMSLNNAVSIEIGQTGTVAAAGGTTLTLTATLVANSNANLVFGSPTDTGTILMSVSPGFAPAAPGAMLVAGGTLKASNTSLGVLTGNMTSTTVASGATLDFNGQTGLGATIRNLQGSGIVTNSSELTVSRGNFGGMITGAAGLIKNTADTLTLTGTNTYTGGTAIAGGTLSVSADRNLGNAAGALSFNGGILQVTGTGFAGTSRAISLGADGGSFDIVDAANTFAVSQAISGPSGKLVKAGAGTLKLTGANTYTGGTTVDAGTLIVGVGGSGSILGPVEVKSGARLGGTGTIGGNVTVLAGGVHGAGNSIGTQTINGNYVNHGTLEVEATPAGADKLVVNGTVDIAGAKLNLLMSPPTNTSWNPTSGPFTLIQNDGADAVTGTFASVGNLNNLLFLDHSISYAGGDGGNDVTLTLTRNDASLGSVAQSPNQGSVAAAIGSLPENNAVRAAFTMSTNEDEARDALDQLSGDVHASASGGSTQTSQFLGEFANDRVRSAFGDVAAPALPVMAYGDGGPEFVAADSDRFVVWGQALGNWGSVDGDSNAAGFDHSSGGLVAGGDTIVGGDWRLGLLAGYSRTSFDTDDGASSGNSDNFHVGVYGGRHFGAVGLRAGAAYTRHSIDTSRTVSFPGLNETLKADYDAGTAQVFVEAGYRLDKGRVAFEPFAGLAYVSTSTDGFTETGGSAALTSADQSFDSTTTTLGLRAATDFNLGDAMATARAGLGWRHAFGEVTPASAVAFAGGDSFTVYGAPIARDALLVEAGLDFAIAPKANLGLSYTGQIANGARDHGVKASLGVKF